MVPADYSSSNRRNKTPFCDESSPAASAAAGVASDRDFLYSVDFKQKCRQRAKEETKFLYFKVVLYLYSFTEFIKFFFFFV